MRLFAIRWRTGAAALVALGVLGALGGCSDSQSTMPEAASIELRDQVEEVREAARAGDVDAARGGLAEIHTTLEALRANGQISVDQASRITAATDDVSRHLALITTTTVPTPATAPPPTAPPPGSPDEDSEEDDDDDDEDDEDDERGGKGPKENNGRGKGRD